MPRAPLEREGEISPRTFAIVMLLACAAVAVVWGANRLNRPSAVGPSGLVVAPVDEAGAGPHHATPPPLAAPAIPPPRPERSIYVHRGDARFQGDAGAGVLEVVDFGQVVAVHPGEVEQVDFANGEAILRLVDGRNVAVSEQFYQDLPAGWRYRIDYVRTSGNIDEPRQEILRKGEVAPTAPEEP